MSQAATLFDTDFGQGRVGVLPWQVYKSWTPAEAVTSSPGGLSQEYRNTVQDV